MATFFKDFCNIPVELQLLLHAGKAVQQECTLTCQGITHGTTIFFCVKGIGGGGNDNNRVLLGKLDQYYSYIYTPNIINL